MPTASTALRVATYRPLFCNCSSVPGASATVKTSAGSAARTGGEAIDIGSTSRPAASAASAAALAASAARRAVSWPVTMRRTISQANSPSSAASPRKTGAGKPGIAAMPSMNTAAIAMARGSAESWRPMSWPRFSLSSEATRVTTVPAAMAMNIAGICATRPSPTVSSV